MSQMIKQMREPRYFLPICDTFFEHILVHTGQNYDYELNEIFFNDLEIIIGTLICKDCIRL